MDVGSDFIEQKTAGAMMNKLAKLRVAGHGISLQSPGVGRISFDGQAEGLMLVEEVSQCLTLAPAFAQQAEGEQDYHRQHEDCAQDGTDKYRIAVALRKRDIHHSVLCRNTLERDAILLQHMPVQHVLLGAFRHLLPGHPPFEAFLDTGRHVSYLAFQWSEISSQQVVGKAEALVDGLKRGIVEEHAHTLGGIVSLGVEQQRIVAASQPHQMAYRYGVARHAHNLRGVQQHVYVLPFQYRADSLPLAHTVIGGTGKVSTLGRGHDGEPLPTTLLIQRMPYLAVQKHLSVHQADARLSHDTLYHAYGTQVIGRVGIARDVGVLQEQRYVGIVHTAEHNGYFMRQRVSACHQRIGSLVVEHGYQLGSPGREVVHETGHTEVFCLLHVAVAVQIVFAYIAVQAEKAELFLQQFQSLRSRRIARLERVYQRNTPCLRMGRVCTHEAERKNQYVSGNCLYVLHIRKVLFDLYQQRYECFLRIMDYFFCFCNKEYVFLNH